MASFFLYLKNTWKIIEVIVPNAMEVPITWTKLFLSCGPSDPESMPNPANSVLFTSFKAVGLIWVPRKVNAVIWQVNSETTLAEYLDIGKIPFSLGNVFTFNQILPYCSEPSSFILLAWPEAWGRVSWQGEKFPLPDKLIWYIHGQLSLKLNNKLHSFMINGREVQHIQAYQYYTRWQKKIGIWPQTTDPLGWRWWTWM